MTLAQNTMESRLAEVRRRITAAAERAGRAVDSVTLIAVTKTHPAGVMREIATLGVGDVGENKVQEGVRKFEELYSDAAANSRPRFHLIGHLQSNKARQAVQYFDLIHSVDSVRLAQELNRQAEKLQKTCAVLLQVNVSGEETKSGLHPGNVEAALAEILSTCPALKIEGFMTMAPFVDDAEEARPCFRALRELAAGLREKAAARGQHVGSHLSMGMTNDFEVAIEEGATLVRVGTALFGERDYGAPAV
ncbi:MAG: YggS family pyridoxal phosphate-dependent enzyme [Candidatus Sumerlaeaceae bacterium]|nr:YggS family pyridoxal phosphate-dependent enzyme [Candidatus Sumerlaeaceae bacterium]